ncbi:ImmA/IrrE family metallo-endopeptidase [Ramlibacter alkalitolerans]|uniref:ImmA/IrrE family metallo-endopeptidase n=1 Tax=Ramlibacter alkalitolerans TaxID=2039631 RepID=A0ABS1JSK1_9BURK|nr:ImmA/IrrE family metallo-endopeptidase [Ramlibacter alkalitolerans]MBL0427235.1 ImmA/IrrE family metallo-endopeptidase [Ramlibacter alkalitolerans]
MKPEVNLGRRLVQKRNLKPPVDVAAIVGEYAELLFKPFPFIGVDGLSVNLKVPGKKTKVIVNSLNPEVRQRFTLAHELGHILIPWHVGTIADSLEPSEVDDSLAYWQMELEANTFAAEVLMPAHWLVPQLAGKANLARAHADVTHICQVSPMAAARRISDLTPDHVVYATERDGQVEFSGRSSSTLASSIPWGAEWPTEPYPYAVSYDVRPLQGGRRAHWWRLPKELDVQSSDTREWREILSTIVSDLGLSGKAAEKFKASVSGVLAYANSATKQSADYSIQRVAAAAFQRLQDRDEYREFVKHELFNAFLLRKSEELYERNRKE